MQDYAGYRTQKRKAQQKKKRKWWKLLVVIAVLAAIFVILGAVVRLYPFDKGWEETAGGFKWVGRKIKSIWPWKKKTKIAPKQFLPEGKNTANYLIAVTKQLNGAATVTTMFVASYDARNGSGSLIYFPSDLLVNTPGAGTDVLSNLVELDGGRISMSVVTIENLLGIELDHYILGTDRDISIILSKTKDEYSVDVPGKVSFEDPSLKVDVKLDAGKQEISGRTLASYLTYAPPGKEMDLIKRQQSFAPEFLRFSRGIFDDITADTKKYASLIDSDASDKELAGMWQAFALMKGSKFHQATVPVKEFRLEKTVVHRVDQPRMPAFVQKYVKTESSKSSKRLRLELLNGCGVPGIGQKVASKLSMGKFSLVNDGNADNFDHPETVIIVYGNDKGIAAAAETIRNALEVGRVQAQPPTQDISDITVIIGKDFASK